MKRKHIVILTVSLCVILAATAGGYAFMKKVKYERFERASNLHLYPIKNEFNEYYDNHGLDAFPDSLSDLERWNGLSQETKDECQFTGDKNVYHIHEGRFYKVYLRTIRPRKQNWPFGEETITLLVEDPYSNHISARSQKRIRRVYICEADPEDVVALQVPLPEDYLRAGLELRP
jgi:hypothetical protein